MRYKQAFFVVLLLSMSALLPAQTQTIHVLVALCDNQYQGIVKVPKTIGNGQQPNTNLYWGCGYGISTYFKKSADWSEIKRVKSSGIRLERIVFKHKTAPYYLVADAYDGKYIKDCTIDFLASCAGSKKDTLMIQNKIIGLNGNARLLAYIGHNGLMDFNLPDTFSNRDAQKRDAIILACASKQYFSPYLKSAQAKPLLWTTHLMCPEAYTIHDALATYVKGGSDKEVQVSAANAYNTYQKCGINGAKRLLVTGF